MNVCACEASLEEAHERRDIDHLLYEASNRSSISITRSIVSDIRSTRVGRSRDGPRCGRDLYQDHQQPERIRSDWYEKQARKNASEAWDNDVRARAIERMRAIQCLAMTSSSWQQLCSILSNVIEADHHAKVRTTAITGSSIRRTLAPPDIPANEPDSKKYSALANVLVQCEYSGQRLQVEQRMAPLSALVTAANRDPTSSVRLEALKMLIALELPTSQVFGTIASKCLDKGTC